MASDFQTNATGGKRRTVSPHRCMNRIVTNRFHVITVGLGRLTAGATGSLASGGVTVHRCLRPRRSDRGRSVCFRSRVGHHHALRQRTCRRTNLDQAASPGHPLMTPVAGHVLEMDVEQTIDVLPNRIHRGGSILEGAFRCQDEPIRDLVPAFRSVASTDVRQRVVLGQDR